MAQYRKKVLTKMFQNYPEINYNSIGYSERGRYNSTEPYQSYSNYDFPVGQELSNKSLEYTFTKGPSNRIIFRSYFRPVSYNDNISEYSTNKYGQIKFPRDLYSIGICPNCRSKNEIIKLNKGNNLAYETRTFQKNLNINISNQLCQDCRNKMLANSRYNMNTTETLNKTFSPRENQTIYLMPYGKKGSEIKKCTCKRRTINLPIDNKIILTEDKDIVNQKSKNLKTETVMDSINSNPNINILSKEKEDITNNEFNNDLNVNDDKKESVQDNNLVNDEQKKNINESVPQENLNINEQSKDLNKNIENIGEIENDNDNVKEPDLNGDMNHNELIEDNEENVHEEQNVNIEENNNLDSGENNNLVSGENNNLDIEKNIEVNNDNIEKENENNIPQEINENQTNKINQNEGEQNELLNYYRNKDDEVNYYDNENQDVKENKLLNSNENENKGFNNNGNEQEEMNNEKIENNENVNINEDEQNGEYKIKYVELERDDIPDNKNDQNILNNINTNEDSLNKKDEQEQENLQQTHDNNINVNNMDHLENEVDENKDNNFNQNEIMENENNDLGNEQSQLLNKDNLENEEKNSNGDKDINMENEAHDAKINLNGEENQYMNQNSDNEKEENININKNHQKDEEIVKDDNNDNDNYNEEEDQIKLNQKVGDNDNELKDEDNNEGFGNDNENENNDNIDNDEDNNKKENAGEFEEIDYENKNMDIPKTKKNSQKSSSKTKPKIPKSGEVLFNPKKSKRRSYKPLFNKYELLELNNRHRQGFANLENESVFKKAKEIFPSKYGIEMPYKSPIRQSNYSVNSLSRRSIDKSIKRKTISEKKNQSQIKVEEETPVKEFDYLSQKNGQFKMQKYEKKTYYMYKVNIRTENPFEGLSHYDKNTKERKSLIAKQVEKEENEYNEINSLEGSIIKNRELNEEELNQLIIKLIKFMYDDEEKNLEQKELYEFKIHRVSNIIKFMNEEAQKKILEELQKNAKDEYSTKLFEILKAKIDEYKEKLNKSYKIENDSKNQTLSFKLSYPNKKVFKKFIKKSKK